MTMTITSETTFEEFVEHYTAAGVKVQASDPEVRRWYENELTQAGEYAKITTIPACPAWCENPAGHEYDSWELSEGTFVRHHSHAFGEVTITQSECNKANEVTTGEVAITTEAPDLTGPKARELAADLVRAADLYDVLTAIEAAGA